MAHSTLVFKNAAFGTVKSAPVGFSWTTLFFGFFPALFRGDFKWAAIIFFITAVAGVLTIGWGAWIAWIVFAVIYNKMYIKELLNKGYVIDKVESKFTVEQLQAQLEITLAPAEKA